MCVDMGGSHFRERGSQGVSRKGGFTGGSRKGGFTGGSQKGGSREPYEPQATSLHAVTYIHLIAYVTLQSAAKVSKVENILEAIVPNDHLVQSRLRRPPFGCLDRCIG